MEAVAGVAVVIVAIFVVEDVALCGCMTARVAALVVAAVVAAPAGEAAAAAVVDTSAGADGNIILVKNIVKSRLAH